jgi:Helix-turn-helix domain of resolvase
MGRKPILTPYQIKEARQRIAKGEKTRDVAKVFNVSISTISPRQHVAGADKGFAQYLVSRPPCAGDFSLNERFGFSGQVNTRACSGTIQWRGHAER